MGCYGLGITRLMGAIVEISHDEKGIIWPVSAAPFSVHLILLEGGDKEKAEEIYNILQKNNFEVLYDDRSDKTAGEKFNNCDLIGIPLRIVMSKNTGKEKVEIKLRNKKETEMINIKELIKNVERIYSIKQLANISQDIAIDLGTANCLVYVRGRGIILSEPSVVALNKKTNQVLAIGREAEKMVGKTPGHIVAIRPLVSGVISDFEVTEQMLRYLIQRAQQERFYLLKPRVIVGIPSGVTEVEKKAVIDATKSAGAREVFLIEEPMAATIGARVPVHEPAGNFIVDIGGGTTEVAVISLGGIVVSKSLRVAGDKLNQDIVNYAQEKYRLLIGERTAEKIKISIGAVFL